MASEIIPSLGFHEEDPYRGLIRVPLIDNEVVRYDVPPNEHAASTKNGPFEMALQAVTVSLVKALNGEIDREYTLHELAQLVETKTGESTDERDARLALHELGIVAQALGAQIFKSRGSMPSLYSWDSKVIFVAEASKTTQASGVPKDIKPTPKPVPKPFKKPVPAPPRPQTAAETEQKIHSQTKVEQQEIAFLDKLQASSQAMGIGPSYQYLKKNWELAADDPNKQQAILLDAFTSIHKNLPYVVSGTPQSKIKGREKHAKLFAQALRFIGEGYEDEFAEEITSRLVKADIFTPNQLATIGNRAMTDMVIAVSHDPIKRNPAIVLPKTFLKHAAIMLFHTAIGPGLSLQAHQKLTDVQRVSADLGLDIGHGEDVVKRIDAQLTLPYRCVSLLKQLCDQLIIRKAIAKIETEAESHQATT